MMGSFERDAIYRIAREAVRYWVIEVFLENKTLPTSREMFFYSDGPNGIDWGNAPGPDDPDTKPLRGKRIRVTSKSRNTCSV